MTSSHPHWVGKRGFPKKQTKADEGEGGQAGSDVHLLPSFMKKNSVS